MQQYANSIFSTLVQEMQFKINLSSCTKWASKLKYENAKICYICEDKINK